MFPFARQRSRKAPTDRGRPCLEALEDRCLPSTSVAFLGTDTTTQGSWQGAYGGAGYCIVGDATSLPGGDKVTPTGNSAYTYANPTDDLSGLQKAATPGTRIEAGWFNYVYGTPTTSFSVEINKLHGSQVSFYVQDWDGGGRAETITAVDAKKGTVLDTESVSNFRNGVYLSWGQTGDVVWQFTRTAGPSAEVSAVFFGGASAAPPAGGAAAFVGQNGTADGNWQSAPFGTEGYNVYGATALYPYYANVSYYGTSVGTYTFAASTTDPRGLQSPASPGGRVAVARYAQTNFTIDVNVTDGIAHEVTLYAVDWDNGGRSERFDLYDNTTGALLDSETLSNFAAFGQYLSWDVIGHVQIRVTTLTGPNAVVEGELFDKDPPPLHGSLAPLATGTAVTTSGPPVSANNTATFLPPSVANGVDVVALDRLFAKGRHLQGPYFGAPGLTDSDA